MFRISLKFPELIEQQRVWLMPEGATKEELLHNAPDTLDACEKYLMNFSSRQHVIYGFI